MVGNYARERVPYLFSRYFWTIKPVLRMRYEIIHGDNMAALAAMADNSVDSVCTDPPYGLGKEPDAVKMLQAWIDHGYLEVGGSGFMGKQWDAFVPQPIFWKEVYRVLKPGGHVLSFAGTRTYDWMVMAIRLAGFEIRDQLVWMYGCLSEDTEILTENGWQKYSPTLVNQRVCCYIRESKEFTFAYPTHEFKYKNEHPAYRIQSDHTDQLVSRNHRVLVERSGKQVFEYAEALQSEEVVPFLESLHDLPESIPVLDKGASIEKQDLLKIVQWQAIEQQEDGCIAGAASSEGGGELRHLRKGFRETGYLDAKRPALLQPPMQRQGEGERFNKAQPQGGCGMDGRIEVVMLTKTKRVTQPRMEGWCHIQQTPRELRGCEIRSVPNGIPCYGTKGRLRNGTSIGNGQIFGQDIGAGGGCASHQPRFKGQPFGESDAVSRQWDSQAIRGTAATVTEVEYDGNVWCVTVPTGAFVARRNGKIFITGNSGFPKSANVSKHLDKQAGAVREVVGKLPAGHGPMKTGHVNSCGGGMSIGTERSPELSITIPSTPEAQQWDGWGTASPSHEPIVLARKPLEKGLTIAQNVLKWGTGALNIDGCRVPSETITRPAPENGKLTNAHMEMRPWMEKRIADGLPLKADFENTKGRWPSNLLLANVPSVLGLFPENAKSGTGAIRKNADGLFGLGGDGVANVEYGDSGSASRYFFRADLLPIEIEEQLSIEQKAIYCSKPSKYERSLGVAGEMKESATTIERHKQNPNGTERLTPMRSNFHPTVKPVALMHHLVTLITPPNGVCLDPFLGSGTTGIGAMLAGPNIRFIGLEMTAEYIPIATDRIKHWKRYRQFIEAKATDTPAKKAATSAKAVQGSLF